MIVRLHTVTITATRVEAPGRCPHCDADLSRPDAVYEDRLLRSFALTSMQQSLADDPAVRDAIAETDTTDNDTDYQATTAIKCDACKTVLAAAPMVIDGVEQAP